MKNLGMTDAQYETFVEKKRAEQFLAACRRPGRWLDRALLHRRGADILFDVSYKAYERNLERLLKGIDERKSSGSTSKTLIGEELEDFQDERLLSEYLILIGHGLECLLKGYLLAIIPDLVVNEKRLDKLVANHDLVQLSHDCALKLSLEEIQLMSLISRYIIWGKYTAPLSVKDMPSWIHPDDQREKSLAIGSPFYERNLQKSINGIFDQSATMLDLERKKI